MEVIDLKLPSRGFSISDPSAARCLVDQAQGNLGPEFGQADMDLDITVSLLLERLQQEEETRVTIYSSLQEVLQGDIKSLDRDLVRRIIHLASKDMRETQQEKDEVQLAAGKTLVALAGTFYNWVMYELQCHVGIMELPPIYFLITLGDVASAYALRSEPFLVLTLSKLRFVLRLVETDQMKRALCGVVEGFAQAANLIFHVGDESPFPSCRAADYGFHVLPFFNLMSSSWLTSEDLELQQAAVKALGPAMGLLLHHERHRNTVFERLPCLLQQYEGGVDNLHVTMSLSQLLEVAYDFEVPLPDGKLKSICFALHTQVCDIAQMPGSENQVKVFYCLHLLACLSPDQFISFVGSRLKTDKEGSCVASLSIFSGIIAADLPEMSQKKCAVVKAMRCMLGDQSAEVKKAVLHFVRTLLSVQGLDDWAWDLVAYIFKQSSLSRSQMVRGMEAGDLGLLL
ncbi:maestro heat-like repeat-containing protein family member 2B [Alligator mississippiensis]|uniref:maestro heat-like repeat-containing protein family member 2B n=1 Tax=Alligator mississippiensis TaxID=8496 RepID=UPI0028775303|nr:maestro heat-like repeat-containing protein family member 2B [Alligator mississippiensis]